MEKSSSGELRQSSDSAFRQHFIRHGRIRDICLAHAEGRIDFLLVSHLVDHIGEFVCDDCAEVARMDAVTARQENIPHVAVHFVHAGPHGGEKSSPCHYDVDFQRVDFPLLQNIEDGFPTHLVLVHHAREFRDLVGSVYNSLLEDGFAVLIVSDVSRRSACVDGKYIAFCYISHC